MHGGKDGTLNSLYLHDPSGERRKPLALDLIRGVPKGTIYEQHAGGGGGYGDPRKRPRALVAKEVRNGIISPQVAHDDYGVVIDETNFAVNEKATDELRGASSE